MSKPTRWGALGSNYERTHSAWALQGGWRSSLAPNLRHLHFDICSIRWAEQLRSAAYSGARYTSSGHAAAELGSIFDTQMEGIMLDMILPSLQLALQALQVWSYSESKTPLSRRWTPHVTPENLPASSYNTESFVHETGGVQG